MSKYFEQFDRRAASYVTKRRAKEMMYRVKIVIFTTVTKSSYGYETKMFYREENAANEAKEQFAKSLNAAMSGEVAVVDIAGMVLKADTIIGYKVKIRPPKVTADPIPETMEDDED